MTLQTEHRNWEGALKQPTRKNENGVDEPIPPSEDTGRRNLFIEPFKNLFYEFGNALGAAKVKDPAIGDLLKVVYVSDRQTNNGAAKQYQVFYKAQPKNPVAGAFGEATPATPPPAPAPAADPFASAPAAPAQAPAADPWAGTTAPADGTPPF